MLIDFIIYPLLFLFVWVNSFLFHELCHILGTGRLHGTITVDGLSMSASPAALWAGGILSGFVFSVAGGLMWLSGSHVIGYLFIICGVVNLVYGVFETMFLPSWGNNQDYKIGRYTVYIGVTAIMLFIWMVFLR
jgi:hypothetical protein